MVVMGPCGQNLDQVKWSNQVIIFVYMKPMHSIVSRFNVTQQIGAETLTYQ